MRMSTLFRLVALGAVVLVLGVGLCLLDNDGRPDGDLCMASLVAGAAPPIILSLVVVGRPTPAGHETYRSLLADLPSPPPKA
jgi:hypothetical protein